VANPGASGITVVGDSRVPFTSSDLCDLKMKEAQCRFAWPLAMRARPMDAHGISVRSMFSGSGFAGTLAALRAGIWHGYMAVASRLPEDT